MTCGFRFGIMVAILTGFAWKRGTFFPTREMSENDMTSLTFSSVCTIYIYIPCLNIFLENLHLRTVLKMHRCQYHYDLDSFSDITHKEECLHTFYILAIISLHVGMFREYEMIHNCNIKHLTNIQRFSSKFKIKIFIIERIDMSYYL